MTEAFTSAPLDQAAPCPLCGYDLRGLVEPQCPECGFRFKWPELLDPARRIHPYLFEHHPERNVRSFFRTAIGGLRPKRFWTMLHPAQPSSTKRLVYYFLGICGLQAALLLVHFCGDLMQRVDELRAYRVWFSAFVTSAMAQSSQPKWVTDGVNEFGSIQAFIDARTPPLGFRALLANALDTWSLNQDLLELCLIQVAVFVLWPVFTFVILLLFRWSMNRARVGAVHVWRCVVYGSDFGVWAVLPLLIIVPLTWTPLVPMRVVAVTLVVCGLGIALLAYRLEVAYRRYLRFDRPGWTILAAQTIVLLVMLQASFLYLQFWWRPF